VIALRLLDRHLRTPGQSLTSSHAVRDMLRLQMAGLEREVFMVLYLDNQHRLLESETVFSARLTRRRFTPVKLSKGHCVTMPLLSSWPITILPAVPTRAMPTEPSRND
jgi:DNA repair protein RadC